MVYLKDYQYLKPKISYLQKFEAKKSPAATRPKDNSLRGGLKTYFIEYCDNSSIHCFHYFTDKKLKYYEKAIWLLIIIATSLGCIFVYFDLAELYYTQRIQTTVADSVHPVFMITFPSIGFCLRHRIDWPRLQNDAPSKFLPPNVNNETLRTFFTFFEQLADIKLYSFHRFASLFQESSAINLTLIDDVDILTVMDYLKPPCTEVFGESCIWRFQTYNCCDLFTAERTEFGFCYIFNSAVSELAQERGQREKYFPYHNSYAGEGTGLEVEVLLNQNKMKPGFQFVNGLYVMIKQPEQWHADVKFINYNTFTKLAITAQLTETDEMTRDVEPSERRCLFEDENNHILYKKINGLKYWRGNCRTKCHQEYIIKYCKCNLSLLYPTDQFDNITACKPSDFKCIYENAIIFRSEHHESESQYVDGVGNDSMTCNCLNSCNQLLYHGYYSSFPLEGINKSNPVKMVHMDIHFQTPYILKYRTAMRYTFVELLANFGGIIGFFLGASLLSAIELVYYSTVGLYIRFHIQFEKLYRKINLSNSNKVKVKTIKISAVKSNGNYKY